MITFDPDNRDQSITKKVNWSKDGAALTAPDPVPTKEGHSIEGWYYDNNGTETKWNLTLDTVKCTMTLKAKWELSTLFRNAADRRRYDCQWKRSNRLHLRAPGQFFLPPMILPARIPL